MNRFSKAATILLCISLGGCSVHQNQVPELPGPLPQRFVEAGTEQTISEPGRFWEQFNDPTLNDLENRAFNNNLSIKQAIARHDQFVALEKISRASLLPFVNLTGAAGRDKQLSMAGSSDGSSLRLAAVVGYELDLWNRLGSSRNAAAYGTEASMADIKTAFIAVAAQVADLYYLALDQRAQLQLNDQIIASQADTLARMESRYEAGLVPALDVYQARQNIIAARARSPEFAANLAKANHALASLIGQYPPPDGKDGTGAQDGPAPVPEALPPVPPGLPSELVSRRPDIEAALLRIKARDAEVAATVAARFPSFNLTGALGSAGLDYATSISGTVWSLLLDATLPLFDHGRRQAEVERRQAMLHEELARYQQIVLQAFQEVEDALVAGRSGEEQIKLLQERYSVTTATLRLAEEQYFEGLTDYLSVLTAQKNHFDVQAQLLSARRQLISDRLSLMKALGGDWMMAEINTLQENGEIK